MKEDEPWKSQMMYGKIFYTDWERSFIIMDETILKNEKHLKKIINK